MSRTSRVISSRASAMRKAGERPEAVPVECRAPTAAWWPLQPLPAGARRGLDRPPPAAVPPPRRRHLHPGRPTVGLKDRRLSRSRLVRLRRSGRSLPRSDGVHVEAREQGVSGVHRNGGLREVVRTTAELTATRAFCEVSRALLDPNHGTLADDRALDAWIAGHLGTAHHTCGTAPMGPADDPGVVVDQYGRVHGIARLRVADTLILPEAPLRGRAVTAVLIGELIAHAVRHDLC